MSIWKDNTATRLPPTPAPESREPAQSYAPLKPAFAPTPAVAPAPIDTALPRKESLIASDITIEGKIEGGGSVRIAGKFKGDVSVQGDLAIEVGAKLTGGVRADKVTIAGELEGNIEEASRVDLLQTAVLIGDIKTQSVTVAAGARMRGHAEFGWDDSKGWKAGKPGNGQGTGNGAGSLAASARAPRGRRARARTAGRPSSRVRSFVRPVGTTCATNPAPPINPRCRRRRCCASRAASGTPPTPNLANIQSRCRFATIAARKSGIDSSAWAR